MKNPGPIVIGGVGGSGTRVIADILRETGYYIGSDLNDSLDNLWFTLLFKRPRWFQKQKNHHAEVAKGLSLFEKIMHRRAGITGDEYLFLASAFCEIFFYGHDHLASGRGRWSLERIRTILMRTGPEISQYVGWGWKEPNTHIYLEYLSEYFPDLKYILVIRHGLDMAFSRNQAQLYNWGRLLGIEKPSSPKSAPVSALDYWIRANQRAISLGKKLLNDRFYLINFDELQRNPQGEIEKLFKFIRHDMDNPHLIRQLCEKMIRPESPARYQKFDLSCFSAHDLNEVEKMGFPIERHKKEANH